MTHAWLFTGPPGSGRSVAARAFAAALQCAHGGCGDCPELPHHARRHPRRRAARSCRRGCPSASARCARWCCGRPSTPTGGRWQVVLIEDADRLTEAAGNALLKAIEEPPPRTVFLLCTPSTHPDDISVTIRSRCRVVPLRQPPRRRGRRSAGPPRTASTPDAAAWAAAAAQGHVGPGPPAGPRPGGPRRGARRCWPCRAG